MGQQWRTPDALAGWLVRLALDVSAHCRADPPEQVISGPSSMNRGRGTRRWIGWEKEVC